MSLADSKVTLASGMANALDLALKAAAESVSDIDTAVTNSRTSYEPVDPSRSMSRVTHTAC